MNFFKHALHLIYSSTQLGSVAFASLSTINKYLINELKIFKFAFESSILRKDTGKQLTLLEFFKRNCFFRDYIFAWQSLQNRLTTDNKKLNMNHIRFELSLDDKKEITDTHNTQLNSSTSNLTGAASKYSHVDIASSTLRLEIFFKKLKDYFGSVINKSFSFGFIYLQGFAFILFIDACLTDDEPLWEPIEWSLVQTWILFIFSFAWIAENLIVSRYGSYTGRDKRVWFSWYKTFWLIEGDYAINYGVACVFVIVPFYFETNYNLSFVYSWWHWYSRVFFFKFISIFTIILFISYYLQMSVRWLNWKKGLILILLVNIFLSYLIYTQFIMTFFGYFTDPVWYQKTRPIDYIQLSHIQLQ